MLLDECISSEDLEGDQVLRIGSEDLLKLAVDISHGKLVSWFPCRWGGEW